MGWTLRGQPIAIPSASKKTSGDVFSQRRRRFFAPTFLRLHLLAAERPARVVGLQIGTAKKNPAFRARWHRKAGKYTRQDSNLQPPVP